VFRAEMTEPELLPLLLEAEGLPEDLNRHVRKRVSSNGS